jgi:hypothetical protein
VVQRTRTDTCPAMVEVDRALVGSLQYQLTVMAFSGWCEFGVRDGGIWARPNS